ncbi:hypothetical protein [Novosphingobium sp. ST904]|uniref:hypothetical protein n=1 Tax=Novosphingobium sp. ST904 TaxID=1684385 RepID=UPI0006C8765B|nr:hypothetical protein [Novosphingobium sp. ST904]TCM32394.1 hypothetical protein EDF59_12489 [Novosphingobium sp. ST904]
MDSLAVGNVRRDKLGAYGTQGALRDPGGEQFAERRDPAKLVPFGDDIVRLVDAEVGGDRLAIDVAAGRHDDEDADLLESLVMLVGAQPLTQHLALSADLGQGIRDRHRPPAPLVPHHPFFMGIS